MGLSDGKEGGLPRRRLKLEMVDEDGDKITLVVEGNITREKILQLADLMELYSGQSERSHVFENKLVKLARALEKRFPNSDFSSREALEAYAEEYGEEIPLSTVSTYLARLTERGFLERVKGQGFIRYRLARSSEIQEQLR
jgi:DNA-binding transcriptional ArsR family regulator